MAFTTRTRRWGALLTAAALVTMAACGDDDKPATSAAPTAASTTAAASTSPTSPSTDAPASSDAPSSSNAATSTDAPSTAPGGPGTPAPQPLAERTKLRITIPVKIEGFADVILADALGEFDRENLDVEFFNVPGSDALVMIERGDADIITGSPNAAFFNAIKSGLDLRWVLPNYSPNPESIAGLWIRNEVLGDDGVAQADEIRGITVALGQLGLAAPSAQPLAAFLESLGLTLNDIKTSNVQGPDMVVALENEAIESGVVLDPFNRLVQEGGYATLVQQFSPYSTGGYIVGAFRENTEVMDAFTRAMLRTRRTYLEGDYHARADVVAALSEALGVEPSTITDNPSLVWDGDGYIDPQAALDMQNIWITAGVLDFDRPFSADESIDQSSVNRVLAG